MSARVPKIRFNRDCHTGKIRREKCDSIFYWLPPNFVSWWEIVTISMFDLANKRELLIQVFWLIVAGKRKIYNCRNFIWSLFDDFPRTGLHSKIAESFLGKKVFFWNALGEKIAWPVASCTTHTQMNTNAHTHAHTHTRTWTQMLTHAHPYTRSTHAHPLLHSYTFSLPQ